MKTLLINGSPHPNGCTFTALSLVAGELEKAGIETEIVQIGTKDIRGCIGCRKCATLGCCIFHDIVNEIAPKLMEADGVVIGSPVYFAGMNGTLVSFMDRLFYSTGDKRMKVGAAVVSSRRAGSVQTFNAINSYFTISQMPIASSRYWNEVHGYTKEDVMKDEEGVQTMRILGRNMAFLMKAIGLQKEREGLPVSEEPVHTHFIR